MEKPNKRTTAHLQSAYCRTLQIQAPDQEYSVYKLINEAAWNTLREDFLDHDTFDARTGEPCLAFENAFRTLRRDGKL